MKIFPAIDLFGGKVVRLRKGDYRQMTVYSDFPASVAQDFKARGAKCVHIVDLEGAKDGGTPNFQSVRDIISVGGLFCEIGGGIRSLEIVEKYLKIGASRVILGTAAVENEPFLRKAMSLYKDKIAVGADIKDGLVAVRGWVENSAITLSEFAKRMQDFGVKTLICTDISRDGEMRGANLEMYKRLTDVFNMEIIASGGVTTVEEISILKSHGVSGAIIGKAYYEGKISLEAAIAAAE